MLANNLLTKQLAADGYYQCDHAWTLAPQSPIMFVLIVNDFGIEYVGRCHAEHLLHTLQQDYTIKCI